MTLPTNVDTAAVTGTFINADGTPCTGTVTFDPAPCYWIDSAADVTIKAEPIVAALDANGTFVIDVQATDDADLNPVDWTYRVRVRLTDCDTAYSFDMAAPTDTVIDLSDVIPVSSSEGIPIIKGEQGEPGAPGEGGAITGTWKYNTGAPPPASGQVRTTSDAMYLSTVDLDGYSRFSMLERVDVDAEVYINAPNGTWAVARVTAAPTDNGTFWVLPMIVIEGDIEATKNQNVEITLTVPGRPGEPGPPGPPGQWVSLTQAEYDAVNPKDPNVLYVIVP